MTEYGGQPQNAVWEEFSSTVKPFYDKNNLTEKDFASQNIFREFIWRDVEAVESWRACKERSDGIAIARYKRNRVKPCNGF